MSEKKKILCAMSGGVDSSAAAAMLLSQGHEVQGGTMLVWQEHEDEASAAARDAGIVAKTLGIKHHVLDLRELFFEKVVKPFAAEYLAGRTPNPCVLCNRRVKFGALLDWALEAGFDAVATGHYANVGFCAETGRYELRRADSRKDQTYALYALNQRQLSKIMFPLAAMEKSRVRQYALERGLPVADKPDSQEICFVPDGDYAGFIRRMGGDASPGDFVTADGKILGRHKGVIHYTVGQRKGLGISFPEPKYVLGIDKKTNRVVLGGAEEVFTDRLTVRDLKFISIDGLSEPMRVLAKIRYAAAPAICTVIPLSEERCEVIFDVPQRAVTPGQSAVFYDGGSVVGGGVIEK